eukprot:Tbor_TRINITY_DN5377_c3_g3::TRINITY_DN5377_c3_g3_i3::g.4471::m.4471
MECGILRRRVGLDANMACTWCCPHLHPGDMLRGKANGNSRETDKGKGTKELPEEYRNLSHLRKEYILSRDLTTCAYCGKTYARTKDYIKHHYIHHFDRPLPLWMYMPSLTKKGIC